MHSEEYESRSKQAIDIFEINLHRFMEIKDHYKPMEIAEELGISLREVHLLKKRDIQS